jgi:hypothetical protein
LLENSCFAQIKIIALHQDSGQDNQRSFSHDLYDYNVARRQSRRTLGAGHMAWQR